MMLSLFIRRVALSTHRSTATYTRILPSSASTLRYRRTLDNGLHTGTAQSAANPRRNVSTNAVAATDGAKSSTKSTTVGRKKHGKELTPEKKAAQKELLQAKKESERKKKEKAAALRARLKAQAEKKKEAAALQRKRLAEKKKKIAQKAREAKKPKIIRPPPRGLSGFSVYAQELKKPFGEISAAWGNLSEEGKREYCIRAKDISEKRKEEFDAFLKSVTPSDIRRYNRHQRSKGGNPIRIRSKNHGPLKGFMKYNQEFRMRPDQAGKKVVEIAKAAGEAWHSLTQEEKDKYNVVPSESTTA